jgi:hypothetical protein
VSEVSASQQLCFVLGLTLKMSLFLIDCILQTLLHLGETQHGKKKTECTRSENTTHWLYAISANTSKSNTVPQQPPVFCIYKSCVSSDMSLPILSTTNSSEKIKLVFKFVYSTPGRRQGTLNSTDICLCRLNNRKCTCKGNTVTSFTETSKQRGKKDGWTQPRVYLCFHCV